ncbi:CHAP domain-containing protein [Siccirubricoccus deserti]
MRALRPRRLWHPGHRQWGQWWHNAAGLYARSQRPEPGAVMAFRSSGGMSRGHVAVVRQILGPRELLIDHADGPAPASAAAASCRMSWWWTSPTAMTGLR